MMVEGSTLYVAVPWTSGTDTRSVFHKLGVELSHSASIRLTAMRASARCCCTISGRRMPSSPNEYKVNSPMDGKKLLVPLDAMSGDADLRSLVELQRHRPTRNRGDVEPHELVGRRDGAFRRGGDGARGNPHRRKAPSRRPTSSCGSTSPR